MSTIRSVSFARVRLERGFWAERIATNRTATIPTALDKCEETGRLGNFERAHAVLSGKRVIDLAAPGYPFDDTDVYKVLEGAAYALAVQPDAQLDARLDRIITAVAAAQEPDGYLYTTRTICPTAPHRWSGLERWELETDLSHELYNLGHLFEAAVAHFEATGKRELLEVALRAAALLEGTFGPGKRAIWPGHQITEMALVRLYRVTGERALLELARCLLDARGPDGKPASGDTNNQSHAPVTAQSEAVGHAVRAVYMYTGMADVAAETGAPGYVAALERIWTDIVAHKLYITGGIGARPSKEAFGSAYELPNLTAYAETCAAIGLVYFCQRMFSLHGEGSAVDVLERVLFNGLISGVSLDGKSFFYPNPLESFGEYARSPWFGCACCPGNVARFVASVPGYVYAQQGERVYVNLYATGSAELDVAGARLVLAQETRYPWDGTVLIQIAALPQALEFALSLRIPGWARGEVVPSPLYEFANDPNAAAVPTLFVNGASVPLEVEAGYVTLQRPWRQGDRVELRLPMPVRRVFSHPDVLANRGRVALQRGPLVYALEGWDQAGGEVLNLVLPDAAPLELRFSPDLLGGIATISGEATALSRDARGDVRRRATSFTAIPYFAWANRGPAEMSVWIARSEQHAWVRPAPTLASLSRVTASGGDCWRAVNDLAQPDSSRDESHKRTRLSPDRAGKLWIEYRFPEAMRVSQVRVYWFESTDWRHEGPPAAWHLSFRDLSSRDLSSRDLSSRDLSSRDAERWAPVLALDEYGIEQDVYNLVRFEPIVTNALRIEAVAAPSRVVALLEWDVS